MTTTAAGHIITWRTPQRVSLASLTAAITMVGLDPVDLIPDLHPRNALARAMRELCQNEHKKGERKLAARLPKDASGNPRMQLTRSWMEAQGLKYDREAIVTLVGVNVTADDPVIAQAVQVLLNEHIDSRLTSDLTRLVQRIVEQGGSDLMAVRDQGGAYFVPEGHTVVSQLATLLNAINGNLRQFAVTLGHGSNESIASTVADYLLGQIGELREAVKEVNAATREGVKQRRILRAAELRERLSSYSALLGGSQGAIDTAINETEAALLEAMMKEVAPTTVDPTLEAKAADV